MSDTLFALLRRRIGESKESVEKFLANGGAESLEQYSRIVGRYEALQMIDDEIAELEKRYVES